LRLVALGRRCRAGYACGGECQCVAVSLSRRGGAAVWPPTLFLDGYDRSRKRWHRPRGWGAKVLEGAVVGVGHVGEGLEPAHVHAGAKALQARIAAEHVRGKRSGDRRSRRCRRLLWRVNSPGNRRGIDGSVRLREGSGRRPALSDSPGRQVHPDLIAGAPGAYGRPAASIWHSHKGLRPARRSRHRTVRSVLSILSSTEPAP